MKKVIRHRVLPDVIPTFDNDMHSVLKRVYAMRQIQSADELVHDLSKLPSYELMKGIPAAVSVLLDALKNKSRILVVGDFDADGATSSTLAVRALRMMGADSVDFLVPNRFEFGYGLTPEIIDVAKQFDPSVIVTVDNGIASVDGVAAAKILGWQVVVTDHHLPGQVLPEADAIVNPNQEGCEFPSKCLAGVGVIFYVMLALRAALRKCDWFKLPIPNLAQLLDLVALGTVADVVPLDHVNRILVAQGLARIRRGYCCAGLSALLQVGGRKQDKVVAADMGFVVGPRLNAAGRLEDMSIGINCLLSDDLSDALISARELDQLNRERRTIEQDMQDEALLYLDALHLDNEALPKGLCLYQEDWHQGVIGILASRIKDKFHRPVIVFAASGDNEIKGSARSVPGFHMRDALDAVATRNPGLVSKFGGHAMAAGLTLPKQCLEQFQRAFDDEVCRHLSDSDLQCVVLSDGELSADELSLDLAEQLRSAGPWGQGFLEPVFDGEFTLLSRRIVGERHLKLSLQPLNSTKRIDAIAFNTTDETWAKDVAKVNVAFKMDVNEYNGRRSEQLMVEYIQPV